MCKSPINLGTGFSLLAYQASRGAVFEVRQGISAQRPNDVHLCGTECLMKKINASVDAISEKPRLDGVIPIKVELKEVQNGIVS